MQWEKRGENARVRFNFCPVGSSIAPRYRDFERVFSVDPNSPFRPSLSLLSVIFFYFYNRLSDRISFPMILVCRSTMKSLLLLLGKESWWTVFLFFPPSLTLPSHSKWTWKLRITAVCRFLSWFSGKKSFAEIQRRMKNIVENRLITVLPNLVPPSLSQSGVSHAEEPSFLRIQIYLCARFENLLSLPYY